MRPLPVISLALLFPFTLALPMGVQPRSDTPNDLEQPHTLYVSFHTNAFAYQMFNSPARLHFRIGLAAVRNLPPKNKQRSSV